MATKKTAASTASAKVDVVLRGINKKEAIFMDSGSTMGNLALTDRVDGGYQMGRIHNLIGDSHTGKSIMVLSALGTTVLDPRFKDYKIIYDDSENANSFDTNMFGSTFAERVTCPAEGNSGCLEDVQLSIDKLIKAGHPFIYILDSLDGVKSRKDFKEHDENMQLHSKGKDAKGSYGPATASEISKWLPKLSKEMEGTMSTVIIISQTRDNLNAGMFGNRRTRSGGKALKFHSSSEAWLTHEKKITKEFRGKKYSIGNNTKLHIAKTRVTGKSHSVTIPIYNSIGVDDVNAMVTWLLTAKFWEKSGTKVNTKGFFDATQTLKEITTWVEDSDENYEDLRHYVQEKWDEVQFALDLKNTEGRRPRLQR